MSGATGAPLAERLAYLNDAVATASALATAARLGVFARLDRGPVDAATLAADCGIGTRGAARLLAALAGLGLVEPHGGTNGGTHTGAGPDGRTDGGTDGGAWRPAVPRLSRLAELHEMWAGLPDTLRYDRPLVRGDTATGAAALYPAAVGFLATLVAEAAPRAADLVAAALPAGARVLDAGAGAAPWSLAVAARRPDCQVTAVDLPPVLDATRQAVAAAGHADRYRYLAADLFTDDLVPGGFDLVLAGNLCHLFDAAGSRLLLARLAGTLRPGGTLAVIDVLPAGAGDQAPVALYELGLLLRSAHGGVHPLAAYHDWLAAAGLGPADCHPLHDRFPLALIQARATP